MNIVTIVVGPLDTNAYLVENNGTGIIIDPGFETDRILEIAKNVSVKISAVLLTHGHYDHIGGVAEIVRKTGAKVYISEKDFAIANSYKNLGFSFGCTTEKFDADVLVKEGEYDVDGINVKVVETPGHTSGGVCYMIGDVLFAGDTLFRASYGRTDFPTGNYGELKKSITEKLFAIDDDLTVYTGHGPSTTLFFEKKTNPINFD